MNSISEVIPLFLIRDQLTGHFHELDNVKFQRNPSLCNSMFYDVYHAPVQVESISRFIVTIVLYA